MLLDIIRPGVQLLDREDYNWEFVGKLKGTRWEDKWLREDKKHGVRSFAEIEKLTGPVAVLLVEVTTGHRWWNTKETFTPNRERN